MNIIDRIKLIIEYKGISTRKFCMEVGIANGFFDKVKDIGSDKLMKILNTYPDINPVWLLSGDGSMLKSEKITPPVSIVSESSGLEPYRRASVDIPVIDVSAASGIIGHINGDNPDIIDYISLPARITRRGSNYLAVRARGESMSPTIYDSSFVIVRELDRSEWLDMSDEHVFVVVSGESAYLKRVKNRFNKGFIVCMSDNTDKYNYPNFNLQSEEITCIFHAEFLISAKMPNINETYYSRLKQLEDDIDDIKEIIKKIR